MRPEINLGYIILKAGPKITADRLVYRHVNPKESIGPLTAAMFYDIHYHLDLSARDIATPHFF